MRTRGLKRQDKVALTDAQRSRPMRTRGLKHLDGVDDIVNVFVASHADAWIETSKEQYMTSEPIVASHADAWIETKVLGASYVGKPVASHADAWIETR